MNGAPEGYKMDRYGRLRVVEARFDNNTHNLRPYQYACEHMHRRHK